MAGNRRRVVVVGAGLAGASASWYLAQRGFQVSLLERMSSGGGRAGSSPDPETGEPIDTGQHAFMGCYSSTLRWFRRMGTADLVAFQDRLEVPFASVPPVVFRAGRLPAPFNLLGGIMNLPGMAGVSLPDLLVLVRILFARRAIDGMTSAQWADRLGIPVPVRRWLLDPLSLSAVNEQPENGSAYPLARVMRRLARRGGKWSALGWATTGLAGLYLDPVRRSIESAGGGMRTGAWVNGVLEKEGRAAGVRLSGGGEIGADAVILALPPWDLVKAIDGIACCESIREKSGKLGPSPILTVHLWLDSPVLNGPFMGLVSGPFDWVFNRTFMVGPAGKGMQHVCLVRSGAREMLGRKPVELVEMALDCLRRSLPGSGGVKAVHQRIIWETKATVSLVPGTDCLRPGTRTPLKGLFLAGGWTSTGFPDTIESAVISGERAAAAVASA